VRAERTAKLNADGSAGERRQQSSTPRGRRRYRFGGAAGRAPSGAGLLTVLK
jgi:hypothetical protein